ncbi:protein cramped-like isoform X1 [Haliotis rufescens]|uniref:protein cramped-like isoform X1 n=1 Tax=Haliotis rufescens TaxID=6454 RepID=UPI00201F3E72|nr:protein cramped-like isoform X1 [Haliotis rufescens]
MPPGKRRKVSQDENSVRDGVGSRVTPSPAEEKGSQEEENASPTSTSTERRMRQSTKIDVPEAAGDDGKGAAPQVTAPQVTTAKRSSTRVVKKTRRDISPQWSPVKKVSSVQSKLSTPEAKTKRQWEQWMEEDIKTFFDALFEHGKDFDAIQCVLAQRCKKRGVHPSLIKNKNQVRFFYYRTCHKINKFIQTTNDVKKDTQELYALINYGILRETIKSRLNEKTALKLYELIHKGVTNVRIKGKNKKIRTPACNALKKLNTFEEPREEPLLQPVPDKITVELVPRTNEAWSHVQSVAQNPRVRFKLAGDRSVASIVGYLTRKWKEHRVKLKEAVSSAEEVQMKMLTVFPPADVALKPVHVTPYTAPKVDVTFASYKENLMGSPSTSGSRTSKKSISVEETVKPNSDNSSEAEVASSTPPKVAKVACESKPVEAKEDPTHPVSSTPEISLLIGDDNAVFPDKPLFYDFDPLPSSKLSLSGPSMSVHTEHRTDGVQKHVEGGGNDNANHATCKNSDAGQESVDSQDSEDGLKEMVAVAKMGWTVESGRTITLAQLYLMCGQEETVKLEYDWCDTKTKGNTHFTSTLTNMLRRLAHIATVEFRDPSRVKPNTDSVARKSVLCSVCGAVAERSKKEKSRNAKSKLGKDDQFQDDNRGGSDRCSMVRGDMSCADSEGQDVAVKAEMLGTHIKHPTQQIVMSKPLIPNSGDGVFRVPVGVPLVRYPQAGVNQMIQSLQQKQSNFLMHKRRKMVRQKPLIVQRTLLPKAPSGQIVTILPSNPTQLTTNIISPQALSRSPQSLTPQTFSPVSLNSPINDTNRPMETQVITSQNVTPLGAGIDDNSPLLSQAMCAASQGNKTQTLTLGTGQSPVMSTGQPLNVPLSVNTDITATTPGLLLGTSAGSAVPACSTSSQMAVKRVGGSDLSISPPNLSSLLDMSLSCPPPGNVMADKLLDMALVNSNSSFTALLDSASPKCGGGDAPVFRSVDESSRLITPPHSPSHLGPGADTQWLNGEVADMSLTSFLISPAKKSDSQTSQPPTSIAAHFPSSIFSENSQESIVSKLDVDTTLQVMMNENSMDYVSKFESLAAHIAGSTLPRHRDAKH